MRTVQFAGSGPPPRPPGKPAPPAARALRPLSQGLCGHPPRRLGCWEPGVLPAGLSRHSCLAQGTAIWRQASSMLAALASLAPGRWPCEASGALSFLPWPSILCCHSISCSMTNTSETQPSRRNFTGSLMGDASLECSREEQVLVELRNARPGDHKRGDGKHTGPECIGVRCPVRRLGVGAWAPGAPLCS